MANIELLQMLLGGGMGQPGMNVDDMMFRNPPPLSSGTGSPYVSLPMIQQEAESQINPNVNDPKTDLMSRMFSPSLAQEPDAPKMWPMMLAQALEGIGNAFTVRGGGQPSSTVSNALLQRIQARSATKQKNDEERARADRDKARFEYEEGRRTSDIKRQDEIRADDRAFDLYRESGRIGAQEDREARNRQIGKQEDMADRLYNLRLSAAKAGQSVPPDADEKTLLDAIARGEREQIARQQRNQDKPEKVNEKSVALGNSIAIGMYRGVPADPKTGAPPIPPVEERLNQGETPDSLLLEYEMELDSSGVFGQERAEAMKTYEKYVGAAIRKWKANKAMADKNADLSGIKPGQGGAARGFNPQALPYTRASER